MLMRFKGGGPLDGHEMETTYDIITYEIDTEPQIKHIYKAVRHHPFNEDPADYFRYAGTSIKEESRNEPA